jgi:hypothetical protein
MEVNGLNLLKVLFIDGVRVFRVSLCQHVSIQCEAFELMLEAHFI